MRNLFIVIVAISFLACSNEPAKLEIDKSALVNLKAEDSSATIVLKNTGDKALTIVDYTSTCECTVLNLRKGVSLKPHDSLGVKLMLKRGDDQDKASQKKVVYVTIKSDAKPTFESFSFFF